MKIGKKSLKMSDRTIRHFKSQKARDDFERVAQAIKHSPKFRKKLLKKGKKYV